MKENITIEQLYQMAKEKGMEDALIRIQYRDSGGDYVGEDDAVYAEFFEENRTVLL